MATHLIVNERQNLQPNEASENKEEIQLIWLDENINDSSDCVLTKSMLIELNPAVQFYSDFDRCLNLIKSIKDEQIFIIVSGSLVRNLLSKVNNHRHLFAIFIFCTNHQDHQSLLDEYDKIIEIYTDQKKLLEAIREKMSLFEKQTLTFNIFDQKQKSMEHLSKESASFLWHQMLIYVLKQIPQDSQSKQQMIQLCQDYYRNNKNELNTIENFQKIDRNDQAIQWYTDKGFIYKLLNKALRTKNMELLYLFRFFIIDLYETIENKKIKDLENKTILKLYRGTQISNEELQKILENIGEIILTDGFLSSSRNKNIFIESARSNHLKRNFQNVLFEIHADPFLKSITFADIENEARIKDEQEIIFNLNSTFKIYSVNYNKTLNLWIVQLNTTDDGLEKLQEYLTFAKQDIEKYSLMIYFGRLLFKQLRQVDQAKNYFEMLLKSLPADHPDIDSVYNDIGNVHDKRDELNIALKNYEIGYEIRRKRLQLNHPCIAESLRNIGDIHKRKGNYDYALDYYQQILKIPERNYPDDHVNKAIVMMNIGLVYSDKNDFDTALKHLSHAIETFKHALPKQNLGIAICLHKIGDVYKKKDDFPIALHYYHQQLTMREQCLPFDHPDLSLALHSIVDIYGKMDQLENGLDFCRKKLDDKKKRLGKNHWCVADTLIIMGAALLGNDSNKSLQYLEEALSILENCSPPDHQLTVQCLNLMVSIKAAGNILEDAVKYQLRMLDIQYATLSSDHIDIAYSLYILGWFYEHMRNISEARRYYNQSFSIYRANSSSDHKGVKKFEARITELKKLKYRY